MRSIGVILRSNSLLKVSACVTAYILWSMLSDFYIIDFTCTIPVRIETQNNLTIKQAPKYISLTMQGLRKHLRSLDMATLSAHISLQEKEPGLYPLKINRNHFSLPSWIRVVHYTPLNVTVTLAQEKTPSETQS